MPPTPDEASSAETDRIDRRQFARRLAWAGAVSLGLPAISQAGEGEPTKGKEHPKPSESAPARVRVWCEGTAPKAVYPKEIDGTLAEFLGAREDMKVSPARLGDPDAGLADADLDATDVLVWWGRLRHDDVPESRARAVAERVRAGRLGFVALHGSYASKPFRELMGTACMPGAWREDGRPEHVTVKAPDHPIARDVAPFTIPKTAMFAEPFDVPEPEAVVLVSTWNKGETFRSGLTWTIDRGRVAYFRPGHDGFPVLFHPMVRRVIANAALWAARRA